MADRQKSMPTSFTAGAPCRVYLVLGVQDHVTADALTSTLQPLLTGIDPDMTYTRVMTFERSPTETLDIDRSSSFNGSDSVEKPSTVPCQPSNPLEANDATQSPDNPPLIQTPFLSVSLFLKEAGVLSASAALQKFKSPLWRFHHKIELSNARGGRLKVIGRQEFYSWQGNGETQPKQLPLWAVCPVHCGNEHLRFTIFTQHLDAMVLFYQRLVGHDAEFRRHNFCLFTVGLTGARRDVQLALKRSGQLAPTRLPSSFLAFRMPSSTLAGLRSAGTVMAAVTMPHIAEHLWLLRDPDSNCVLIEEDVGGVGSTHAQLPPSSPTDSLFGEDIAPTQMCGGVPAGNMPMPLMAPACVPAGSTLMSLLTPVHGQAGSTLVSLLTPAVPCPSCACPHCTQLLGSLATEPGFMLRPSNNAYLRRCASTPGHRQRRGGPSRTYRGTDWHSAGSESEMADSESVVSDGETSSSSTSGVLSCECDSRPNGSCFLCVRTTHGNVNMIRSDLATVQNDSQSNVIFKTNGVICQNPVYEGSPKNVKRRPWEVDMLDLSHKEWEDLVALSRATDTSQSSSHIDIMLNNLNINMLT